MLRKTATLIMAAILAATTAQAKPTKSSVASDGQNYTKGKASMVEVEWLESHGTEYYLFPEGINGVDCWVLPFSAYASSYGGALGRWNGGSRIDTISYNTAQDRGLVVVNASNAGQVYTNNLRRDALFHVTVHGGNVSVNDSAYTMGAAWNQGYSVGSFALFAYWNTASLVVNPFGGTRIGLCKLFVGEAVVHDLVPVRFLNADGVWEGAMLDNLTGEVLRNQGTGAFSYGPDVKGAK